MPVTVALIELVSVRDSRALWPEQFRGLITALESEPTNRDQLLVIADNLQELDEPMFEAAFRYVAKRTEIELRPRGNGVFQYWYLDGVKYALTQFSPEPADNTTAAGAFAILGRQLDAARRDLD